MDVSNYVYDIGVVNQYFVIQHGMSAPFHFLPAAVENIYQGFYQTPLISINTTADGCESPYPTPVSCIVGPLPNDPYNSYGDDYWLVNYATFIPKVIVYHTNANFVMDANPDPFASDDEPATWQGTHSTWLHRVVYP